LLTTLERGGTERLVLLLAREQIRLGCHVEVAALRGPGPALDEFGAAGIVVHPLGLVRKVSPRAYLRLRRLIRQRGYQVVHSHLDLADLYAPFAVGGSGPIVVSTRHNTDPWRVRRSWKRPPFLFWERAAHRRAGATIAVSRAVRDFLVRSEGLDPERFVVIPNGIDLAPFLQLPESRDARAELVRRLGLEDRGDGIPGGTGEQRPVAGFVGRLADQKGVDLLLEAVARLGDSLDLVLIGDGPLEDRLRERAARPDLEGRVFFAGHQDEIATLLPAFNLFAFPSRWEGFGLAAVEAMAAGLPVVGTATDGLREVVENGKTGVLVPPGDVNCLARALSELVRDPERARCMGAAGRVRAFDRFGAERMAAEVVSLYRALLPSASRRAARVEGS
jgi:glycosyltransferase involved in cell wall biosynthesis